MDHPISDELRQQTRDSFVALLMRRVPNKQDPVQLAQIAAKLEQSLMTRAVESGLGKVVIGAADRRGACPGLRIVVGPVLLGHGIALVCWAAGPLGPEPAQF